MQLDKKQAASQLRRRNRKNVTSTTSLSTRGSSKKKVDKKSDEVSKQKKKIDRKRSKSEEPPECFDSIVAVDEGCSLLENPSIRSDCRKSVVGSLSSIVRSMSKHSLKKMTLTRDEDKIEQV